MRHLARMLAAMALLMLVAMPALAQGSLAFTDETGRLDRAAIQRAAEPLLNRGAEVAIYMVRQGSDADFNRRLQGDGLVSSDGRARLKLVAVYVGLDNRYSSIKYGEDWGFALAVNDNFDDIRQANLNPGLAAGNYTKGFTDALGGIENAIVNPPGNPIVDTLPIAGAGVAVAGAGAAAYVISRRRKAARTLAQARQRAQEARQAAGGAITALAQRLQNAEEKAKFDRVSYPAAEVQSLAEAQGKIARGFADAQTLFDDIGEKLEQRAKPEIVHYDEATQGYARVQELIGQQSTQLDQVDARRVELDKLAQQAPGEIDRAKKS